VTKIGDIAKQIRERKHWTTTEMGRALGVNQSQISKYELGRTSPGFLVLKRLLELAEGTERNPVLERLGELLGRSKEDLAISAAMAEVDAMYGRRALLPSEREKREWEDLRRTRPNLVDLAHLVTYLLAREREVDASIVRILRLWLDHDVLDPTVRECFTDAAKYLEIALTTKTGHRSARMAG